MRDIELDVPARPEYVGLVRMMVSSLAVVRQEIEDDRLDDLVLAVSEACTFAVVEPPSDNRLVVRCVDDADVVIEVHGARGATADGFGNQIMRALVDEVEVGPDVITLRVKCGPKGP